MLAVAAGRVKGVSIVTITGRNRNLDDNAVPEALSEDGVVTRAAFLASAQGMQLTSNNAADNASGTGARLVLVAGLDANYDEISEVVVPNGTTPVALTNTYLRVNTMIVVQAGSNRANVGRLNLTSTGTATTMRRIIANESLDHSFLYTVPRGQQIVFGNFFTTLHTPNGANTDNAGSSVSFIRTLPTFGAPGPYVKIATWDVISRQSSNVLWPNPHPNPLDEYTDLIFEVDSVAAGGTHDMSAGLNVYKAEHWNGVL